MRSTNSPKTCPIRTRLNRLPCAIIGVTLLVKAMSVTIPDDIVQSTQMTEAELKVEIAVMLYKQQKISSGKARAWTGLTVIEFQHELAKRGLFINYDVEDLEADIKTLQSLDLL